MDPRQSAPRISGTKKKLALTTLLLGALALLVIATMAAFTAITENENNQFDTAQVTLTDNDSGVAMLNLTNAVPDAADVSCIEVTYEGSAAATVRLYGTTSGTGLDQYLNLTVTRGTGAAAFDDCTGFSADTGGVIYNGTLQGYADNYATGIDDGESWTEGESHWYKFEVSLQDNAAAQSKDATQKFTWEARNS